MLAAQEEADQLYDAELDETSLVDDAVSATVPKLLQISGEGKVDIKDAAKKINDLQAKGAQLDLLLLKAETYSHFIRSNQDRSVGITNTIQNTADEDDKKKRKRNKKETIDATSDNSIQLTSLLSGGQVK